MFKKIQNPDLYHGAKKKKNFFEGWYFKIADEKNQHVFAFIPGIIKGKKKNEGHAFVQVLDGVNHKFYYLKYPQDSFSAEENYFQITVGNNSFSLKEVMLSFNNKKFQLKGKLRILDSIKWPSTKLNPGSMGFYNYLCFMECYSQVCCLDGNIIGKLVINNEEIDFSGGKIYIEKNWGSRFPENYIWIQGNQFLRKDAAVSVSLGLVPLWFYRFNGFIAAFVLNKKVYKFTTMNHSKMKIDFNQNNVTLTFKKNHIQLSIETRCKKEEFLTIKGPKDGVMSEKIKESIESEIKVELLDLKRKALLFQGLCQNAGVELMGNIRSLVNKKSL